jgi:uncharacterized repeat protein (TIGR03803 family)
MGTNFYKLLRTLADTWFKRPGIILLAGFVLSGCGGGSSSSPPATTTFTVGGIVTGLAGSGLVLQNNGADNLTINANGSFTFATGVASGGSYTVTVLTPVAGQTCTVGHGSGANLSSNVKNVTVICSATSYTVSGNVTGLLAGQSVTLENNAADATSVASNTTFTFSRPVAYHSSYAITVSEQPVGQDCTVTNGSKTNITANVTDVVVTCGPATYSVLYAFGASSVDAINPTNNIVLATDGNFYGTSRTGGANNDGAIFKMTSAGSETVLNSFSSSGTVGYGPDYNSGLIVGSDGNLYGMTSNGGGSANCGSVFKTSPAGVVTTVYTFAGPPSDGCSPHGRLVLGSDGNYYGMTYVGGANNKGTVFKITPTQASPYYSESLLHSFGSGDGQYPMAGLVEGSPGIFYGVTESGGSSGNGAVITITSAGAENVLYSFAGFPTDGGNSFSGLTLGPDGNFYGVTENGGTDLNGVVFKITPAGVETVIHNFAGGTADGAAPNGSELVLGTDNNFYSTTINGGANSDGVLYKITPAGEVTLLHSFAGGADGASPTSSVVINPSNGHVYGTTPNGGTNSGGIFFSY